MLQVQRSVARWAQYKKKKKGLVERGRLTFVVKSSDILQVGPNSEDYPTIQNVNTKRNGKEDRAKKT